MTIAQITPNPPYYLNYPPPWAKNVYTFSSKFSQNTFILFTPTFFNFSRKIFNFFYNYKSKIPDIFFTPIFFI